MSRNARFALIALAAALLGGYGALRLRPVPPPAAESAPAAADTPAPPEPPAPRAAPPLAPVAAAAAAPAPAARATPAAASPAAEVAARPAAAAAAPADDSPPLRRRDLPDGVPAEILERLVADRGEPVSATITGRVVRPDGTPIEGAWIDDHDTRSAVGDDPFGSDDGPVRTRADGRFAIASAVASRKGAPVQRIIVAMLTGYRPASSKPVTLAAAGARADVGDIVMKPAGKGLLRARVRRADGGAFEGPFEITAQDPLSGASGFERGKAGPDGTADPIPLTAGRYQVAARVPGYTSAAVAVEMTHGATVDVDLLLSWEGRLVVRVLDDETGAPVAGASVALWDRGASGGSYDGTSDSSGLAVIREEKPPGPYTLHVMAEGYGGITCEGKTSDDQRHEGVPVDIAEGPREGPIVVRLLRGNSVEGVVRDAEGRPAPSTLVVVDGWGNTWNGKTEDSGAFRISGFGVGAMKSFRLVASGGDAGLAWAEARFELSPAAPGAKVDLVRVAGASLSGRVLGRDGNPAAGAKVDAMPASAGGPSQKPEWGDPHAGERASTTAGADGTYRLTGIRPGATDVIAYAPGHAAATARGVALREGENALDLTLGSGGTIVVLLSDDLGEPVSKGEVSYISVYVTPSGAEERGTIEGQAAGAPGRWVVEGLQDAPYDLGVFASGHARGEAKGVRPGGPEVHITLARSVRITGRVVVPEGERLPVAGSYMAWPQGGGSSGSSVRFTDRTGELTPIDLEPGAERIELSFAGWEPVSVALPRLGPGESHAIEVRLEHGRTITGRVLRPDGTPAVGAQVGVGSGASDGVTTDAEGRFTLREAPRGATSIMAWIMTSKDDELEGNMPIAAGGDVEGVVVRLAPQAVAPGGGGGD